MNSITKKHSQIQQRHEVSHVYRIKLGEKAQPASVAVAATKALVIMMPAVATIAAVLASLSPVWSFVGLQVYPSLQVGIGSVCFV